MLLSLVVSFSAFAAEVDNHTKRFLPINDSTDLLNKRVNVYFQKALHEANKAGRCDKDQLYKALRGPFSNHTKSPFINEIRLGKLAYDTHRIEVRESIYRQFTRADGRVLGRAVEKNERDRLAPLIRVGDYYVSSDKFEHMFGRGYAYFKKYHLKGDSLESTLRRSIWQETHMLGGSRRGSGVFSFGDLVANFAGMRFWNHMLNDYPDILGENWGPYVACEMGRWVVAELINIVRYVDHGFDEAINCSQFATASGAAKVRLEVSRLVVSGQSIFCPTQSIAMDNLKNKFGELWPFLLNDRGHIKLDMRDFLKNYSIQR